VIEQRTFTLAKLEEAEEKKPGTLALLGQRLTEKYGHVDSKAQLKLVAKQAFTNLIDLMEAL
jgi:hypothetical protein